MHEKQNSTNCLVYDQNDHGTHSLVPAIKRPRVKFGGGEKNIPSSAPASGMWPGIIGRDHRILAAPLAKSGSGM